MLKSVNLLNNTLLEEKMNPLVHFKFARITTLLLLTSLLFSCASKKKITKMVIKTVEVTLAQKHIVQNQAIVIDVRTPEEYKISHIEGAVNINISADDFAQHAAKLSKDKTYILHCSANVPNGRTEKALTIMDGLGFNEIYSLTGGIVQWDIKKLPLIKPDPTSEIKTHH